jgi:hypothetical protein
MDSAATKIHLTKTTYENKNACAKQGVVKSRHHPQASRAVSKGQQSIVTKCRGKDDGHKAARFARPYFPLATKPC